ncbi:MAG: DUF2520 domain-containing protein [Chitinophagales bacterium]|nr:DUF2520 domain-containing protein [Chitinophagales bacterium]
MKTSVVIVGTGNVAWHICNRLRHEDCSVQIFGRHPDQVRDFIRDTSDFSYISDREHLQRDADYYLLCVKDDDIIQVANELPFKLKRHQVLVHTSGSMTSEVLAPYADHYGVLWPIMSLKKHFEVQQATHVPYVITGSDAEAEYKLTRLATKISESLSYADDAQRQKMHLMAVVTNNFTNHLFALAYKYCKENHINFNNFIPIINETVSRMQDMDPKDMQTGPASRGDQSTINRHLEMLESDEALAQLYAYFSRSIQKMYIP